MKKWKIAEQRRTENEELTIKLKKWYKQSKKDRRIIKQYVYSLDKLTNTKDNIWNEIVR